MSQDWSSRWSFSIPWGRFAAKFVRYHLTCDLVLLNCEQKDPGILVQQGERRYFQNKMFKFSEMMRMCQQQSNSRRLYLIDMSGLHTKKRDISQRFWLGPDLNCPMKSSTDRNWSPCNSCTLHKFRNLCIKTSSVYMVLQLYVAWNLSLEMKLDSLLKVHAYPENIFDFLSFVSMQTNLSPSLLLCQVSNILPALYTHTSRC